jgi:hypothetical protein
MRTPHLLLFILFCSLLACSKHDNPPIPPPVGTIHISLSNGAIDDLTEVIISETGGKILLDTLSPFTGKLVADLRTNEKLVNITVIARDTIGKTFGIVTEMGVNPAQWTSLYGYGGYFAPIEDMPYTVGTLQYKGIPALPVFDGVWTSSGLGGAGEGTINMGQSSVPYINYGINRYVYTLLPHSGLYNFHLLAKVDDIIDLSHLDTAVKVNLQIPAEYKINTAVVVGIMDTTDYNKSLLLWQKSIWTDVPDIEYPAKLVQRYESEVQVQGNDKNRAICFSYADSVPSHPLLPASSSLTVSSSQNNRLIFSFNGVHPSTCHSFLASGRINWSLNSSPDSTSLQPVKFLTSLNAKMLKGVDLSTLTVNGLQYEIVDGMDYAGYKTFEHTPDLHRSKRIRSAIIYAKDF